MRELRNRSGAVRRAFSLSLDQSLHASDEILELLPVATCICDLDGRIVQYNRRAVELWGRAPQPGQTHEQFTARQPVLRIPWRGAAALADRRSAADRAADPRRGNRGRQAGRGRIAVLINIDPLFDARGKMVGVITASRTSPSASVRSRRWRAASSELREQEERWNATYEHAAIGIVEIDADGQFLRVNEAICDITGLTREQLLGWTLFARTHPDDRDVGRGALPPAGGGRDRLLFDREALRPQGRARDLVLDPLLDGARRRRQLSLRRAGGAGHHRRARRRKSARSC